MNDAFSIGGLPRPSEALFESQAHELNSAIEVADKSPEEAADRFQHLLSTMLVREIRKTLPEGFFGGGVGADTYDGWMDDHLGRVLADQNALGLAGLIKSSLPTGSQPQADQDVATPEGANQ